MIVTHNAVVAELAHRVLRFRDGLVTGIQQNAVRKAAAELVW
jgi:putative ABC transport system ATP-binding protein